MRRSFALLCTALLAAGGTAAPAAARSSNTAPTRTFTSEWACENGRTVLINAHPRRPREVAHVTYLGNRVSVKPKGSARDGSHYSEDGRVVWQWRGKDEALLSFDGLLSEPVVCKRSNTTNRK